ncbi:hypothetical protein [Streptomyces glaucus]|uniref:Secreted protein n=1 Tax=Streptomyces glaucus TaxID=284029 RepID=A0ABN3K6P5_9ACTN
MTCRTRTTVGGALAAMLLSALPTAAAASAPDSHGPFTLTEEKGHVLDCAGERNGVSAAVQLYENSAFGTYAYVSVRTADTEYLRDGETDAGLFDHGTISREVTVHEGGETTGPARTVVVDGSYTPAGPRQRVHEVHDEPWGQVVVKGWKTPLSAAVTVRVSGQRIDLACGDAFAFDHRVRRPVTSGN